MRVCRMTSKLENLMNNKLDFIKKSSILIFFVTSTFLFSSQEVEKAFTDIYTNRVWGVLPSGEGSSGEGSDSHNAVDYLNFLKQFIESHQIHSIVDIGCGDWELFKLLDLSNVEYWGFDVVKSLIERNQTLYKAPNIHFIYADAVDISLPQADLLICKDVFQHLPFNKIFLLLDKFSTFPYCLITNDISRWWGNHEIACGDYRPLDLFAPPFNLKGESALIYRTKYNTKQVVLLKK